MSQQTALPVVPALPARRADALRGIVARWRRDVLVTGYLIAADGRAAAGRRRG